MQLSHFNIMRHKVSKCFFAWPASFFTVKTACLCVSQELSFWIYGSRFLVDWMFSGDPTSNVKSSLKDGNMPLA